MFAKTRKMTTETKNDKKEMPQLEMQKDKTHTNKKEKQPGRDITTKRHKITTK